MPVEGYFVTEEAEKAAKWDMYEEHRKVTAHSAVLENEFKKISDSFGEIQRAFSMVRGVSFAVDDGRIRATNDLSGATIAVVSKAFMDYEKLKMLVLDLEKSRKREAELQSSLKLLCGA